MLRPGLLAALVGAAIVILTLASAASARTLAFTKPAKGRITAGFGDGRGHDGIDIGMLRRLGVVAAARGRVLRTGYVPGYADYGKIVIIRHPLGFRTLYAHLSKVGVRRGQRLRRGQWIGNAGCTGRCYGTHLHFELHLRGRPVNPLRFLPH
jgi:murein DD-endopeptidase MepM/ murein hydrolase activator NlpD